MQGQRPAGIAARTGLITGLFGGVLSLPVIALSAVTGASGPRLALWLFFLLVALVTFAVAGFIATRRSSLLRSGTGAGSVASLVAAFIAICLGLVIVILLAAHSPAGALSATPRFRRPGAGALRVALVLRSIIAGLLLLVATGPLGGFIGGLLGRLGRPAQPTAARVTPPSGPQPYQPQPAAPLYTGPVTPTSPTIPSVPPPYAAPSSSAFPAE